MRLISLTKASAVVRRWGAMLAIAPAALALAGCISATGPILSDAKALLGERAELHLYSLRDGTAHDPAIATIRWSGGRYVVSGRSPGISDFTVHPYEGRDLIVQATAARPPHTVEFALARRVADGTYLIFALDEAAVDDPTRAKFCSVTQDAACRVTTPEQLFVFARATADAVPDHGGLAIIVAPKARERRR
jgi:hypothetical protein